MCSKEFSVDNRNFAATNGGGGLRKSVRVYALFPGDKNCSKAKVRSHADSPLSTMLIRLLASMMLVAMRATSRVGRHYNDRYEELPKCYCSPWTV